MYVHTPPPPFWDKLNTDTHTSLCDYVHSFISNIYIAPLKFEVGGRPMHPSPYIFWEVVLSDSRQSANRVKKVSSRNYFLK